MAGGQHTYIIDGHNLLKKAGPRLGITGGDHAEQRDRLAEVLLEFRSRTGATVNLVFDGSGPDRPVRQTAPGVTIEYARGPGGADKVIEGMVRRLVADRTSGLVYVVTDDRGIRDTVTGRYVRVIATSALVEMLDEERGSWADGSTNETGQGAPRRPGLGSLLPADVVAKLERIRRGE